MKIDKRNPKHWIALARFTAVTIAAFVLRKTLGSKRDKPIIILYGHKLNSNLKALYLELEKHTDRYAFYFLTMDTAYYKRLKSEGNKVINGCRMSAIKEIANVSVIVTDHGLHCLEIFLGRSDVKFMDVWHGIPFKGFDADDFRTQHKYDAICVTSEYLKEIYIDKFGFDAKKIKITGYGRTDLLLKEKTDEDYKKNGIPNDGRKIVTYAPTWKQDDNKRTIFPLGTSKDIFLNSINSFTQEHEIIFIIRSHLNHTESIEDSSAVYYRPHSYYEDTESILKITDVLITDWSSIYFDFLILNRATIFLGTPIPFKKGLTISAKNKLGPTCNSIEELKEKISYLTKRNQNISFDYSRIASIVHEKTTNNRATQNYKNTIETLTLAIPPKNNRSQK